MKTEISIYQKQMLSHYNASQRDFFNYLRHPRGVEPQ